MAAETLPLRYVVLHHEGVPQPHYDLLFESAPDSPLFSVRCTSWPPTPATTLQRIPHHRRLYLDYEGPISGDRGQVRRIAAGTCAVDIDKEDSLVLMLDTGLHLRIPGSPWD